ncbi:hypothetical protein CR492_03130 [Methylocella silvestris]|uniref:Uncharacterized protein n=2 Tax=Methylocella silvestris TaxID=199596 RepID=A0A2J7TMA3_METSI|nr:hypothetical protein CR492_03130 [Methylocella silvestris]
MDARPALLINGSDEILADHDAEAAKAHRSVERIVAIIAKLEADLAAARAKEKADADEEVFARAQAAQAEAKRLIEGRYARAAKDVAAVLEQLRVLQFDIDTANRILPAGAPRYGLEACRHRNPDPPVFQIEHRKIFVNQQGTEFTTCVTENGKLPGGMHVEFRDVEVIASPERVWTQKLPLVEAVVLPGLRPGDLDFWSAIQ